MHSLKKTLKSIKKNPFDVIWFPCGHVQIIETYWLPQKNDTHDSTYNSRNTRDRNMHIYTHTNTYTQRPYHSHLQMYTHMHINTNTQTHTHTHTQTYICKHTYKNTQMHTFIHTIHTYPTLNSIRTTSTVDFITPVSTIVVHITDKTGQYTSCIGARKLEGSI